MHMCVNTDLLCTNINLYHLVPNQWIYVYGIVIRVIHIYESGQKKCDLFMLET